jgi:hypothetical protein
MTEHTPGPWRFVESPAWGYSALFNPETREEVLVTGGQNDGDSPETWMGEELTDANRALIEAAPDLLAALEELHALVVGECPSLLNEESGGCARLDMAVCAAIAKAKGDKP